MALAGVEAVGPGAEARARQLAQQLNIPILDASSPTQGSALKLVVGSSGIALGFVDRQLGKPYLVDFQTNIWRDRFLRPLPRNHIFRRALGVRDLPLKVWDATAGFGQDAMLALSLGCSVTAVEQSPVVAILLADAMTRAQADDEFLRHRLNHFVLLQGDSAQLLGALPASERPDVVYMDPMFEKPKKTAKSPKEMQLLQELLDLSHVVEEEQKLFAAALDVARQRVVVKRPLKAKSLKNTPTHSFNGQSIRYDVYVRS